MSGDERVPHIMMCRRCGQRTVPVPLHEYPVEALSLAERLMTATCGHCGAGAGADRAVLDFSREADDWYRMMFRPAVTE